MLDQVGAVLVVMVVGDIQPHLMDLGRPAQQLPPDPFFKLPILGDLVKGMQRLALDPCRLFQVDVVALHQRAQGALTHVFMMMTAQQVIEHAFTQRTIAMVHTLQFEGVEDGFKDRQAGREDSPAIRLDALEVDFIGITELEQLALEPRQAFGIHLTSAMAASLQGQADGADGTG